MHKMYVYFHHILLFKIFISLQTATQTSLHITFEILVYGVCPLFFYNVIFLTAAGGRKIYLAATSVGFVLVFVFDTVIY